MAPDATTRNTVDSLLNYDVPSSDEDIFARINTTFDDDPNQLSNKRKTNPSAANKENNTTTKDTLGLDSEIKITKKRKPNPKLDEARLLSEKGIPKLRALARSNTIAAKLRLKGKQSSKKTDGKGKRNHSGGGNEYTDAAKLLGFYQLWLDDLFPRANFANGLQMVEKAGRGKRMQVMRREWIDEGKPGYLAREAGQEMEVEVDGSGGKDGAVLRDGEEREQGKKAEAEVGGGAGVGKSIFGNLDEGDDDDEHDGGLFFRENTLAPKPAGADDDDDDHPDDDELDALLAEQEGKTTTITTNVATQANMDNGPEDDDDELDALLAEQAAKLQHSDHDIGSNDRNDNQEEVKEKEKARQSGRSEMDLSKGPVANVDLDMDDDEDELQVILAMQDSLTTS